MYERLAVVSLLGVILIARPRFIFGSSYEEGSSQNIHVERMGMVEDGVTASNRMWSVGFVGPLHIIFPSLFSLFL